MKPPAVYPIYCENKAANFAMSDLRFQFLCKFLIMNLLHKVNGYIIFDDQIFRARSSVG